MRWLERDTSENGNRWTLENDLGIPVSLAMDSEENRCRIRIGEYRQVAFGRTLTEAKALVRHQLLALLMNATHDVDQLRD
jgi:hypothetical protein